MPSPRRVTAQHSTLGAVCLTKVVVGKARIQASLYGSVWYFRKHYGLLSVNVSYFDSITSVPDLRANKLGNR